MSARLGCLTQQYSTTTRCKLDDILFHTRNMEKIQWHFWCVSAFHKEREFVGGGQWKLETKMKLYMFVRDTGGGYSYFRHSVEMTLYGNR